MTKKMIVPDPQIADEGKKEFKGYTMEELRYQKALALLRKEFCKSNVLHSVESLKHPLKGTSPKALAMGAVTKKEKGTSMLSRVGSVGKVVATSLLRGMKPLDYVMVGISLIGPARKIFRMFRKK